MITNPIDSELKQIAARDDVRVLSFGENHVFNNRMRSTVARLFPLLAENGFNKLFLEIDCTYQEVIDSFLEEQVSLETLTEKLKDASASIFDPGSEKFCPAYLRILFEAKRNRFGIIAMDKDKSDESWYKANFAEYPREQFMADRVSKTLEETGGRVITYGGSNHIYVRNNLSEQKNLSMAELISNRFKRDSLYSVAAVMPPLKKTDGLSFSPIARLLERESETCLVETGSNDRFQSLNLGMDKRCPWGTCTCSNTEVNRCPGVKLDICDEIPAHRVFASWWDAFLLMR